MAGEAPGLSVRRFGERPRQRQEPAPGPESSDLIPSATRTSRRGWWPVPAVKPRSMILDFYGSYGRQLGGWIAVADLISLMGDVGVSESAVRSSVSRMSQRGLLDRSRRRSAAGYALTDQAQAILRDGNRRLFTERQPADLDDGWAMAIFSVPEAERRKRHMLRSRLQRLGFGSAGAGLCIAPRRLLEEAREMLVRLQLDSYVDLFEARYAGFDDLTRMTHEWWDLESLRAGYAEFISTHRPILTSWEAGRGGSDREAFIDYLTAVSEWRRLAYRDPGLPSEVLPEGWEGSSAAELFFAIADHVEVAGRRHVEAATAVGEP